MTFSDFVTGATVALVGPAPLRDGDLEAAEKHDLVYQLFAYCHRNDIRNDIVFLNASASKRAYEPQNEERLLKAETAAWWVYKKHPAYRREGNIRPCVHPNRKHLNNGNQGTLALWDLVRHPVKSVTVYGMDLYAGGPGKSYTPGWQKHPEELHAENLLAHKPMQQLRVHRDAMRSGKVVGDDRYLAAVALTDEEYQAILDRWAEEAALRRTAQ